MHGPGGSVQRRESTMRSTAILNLSIEALRQREESSDNKCGESSLPSESELLLFKTSLQSRVWGKTTLAVASIT